MMHALILKKLKIKRQIDIKCPTKNWYVWLFEPSSFWKSSKLMQYTWYEPLFDNIFAISSSLVDWFCMQMRNRYSFFFTFIKSDLLSVYVCWSSHFCLLAWWIFSPIDRTLCVFKHYALSEFNRYWRTIKSREKIFHDFELFLKSWLYRQQSIPVQSIELVINNSNI